MSGDEFISWSDELRKWRNALAKRDTKSFFMGGHENKNNMRVTYRNLQSIQEFTEWLEAKASEEIESGTGQAGGLHIIVGGM